MRHQPRHRLRRCPPRRFRCPYRSFRARHPIRCCRIAPYRQLRRRPHPPCRLAERRLTRCQRWSPPRRPRPSHAGSVAVGNQARPARRTFLPNPPNPPSPASEQVAPGLLACGWPGPRQRAGCPWAACRRTSSRLTRCCRSRGASRTVAMVATDWTAPVSHWEANRWEANRWEANRTMTASRAGTAVNWVPFAACWRSRRAVLPARRRARVWSAAGSAGMCE